MNSERFEELLQQIVDHNSDLVTKLDELLYEIREIKEELNWIGPTAFAKQVVDGLSNIETEISSLNNG